LQDQKLRPVQYQERILKLTVIIFITAQHHLTNYIRTTSLLTTSEEQLALV